jgi:hypothetical protein
VLVVAVVVELPLVVLVVLVAAVQERIVEMVVTEQQIPVLVEEVRKLELVVMAAQES